MRGFVMLTLYRETPLAPYVALTSATAQLLIDTTCRAWHTNAADVEPMLALTITAVVLVAAGVLWLKPWINDYDEISD